MKTILALDLGTKLGWAFRNSDGCIHHNVENLDRPKGAGRGVKYFNFANWLDGPGAVNHCNKLTISRDCAWVGSILRWLGLKTAVLTHDTPTHMRKEVYQADVVYGTASEFGFDYLRDNSMAATAQEQVQRGHYFAIIDEVDSILIDEARTPLIISGPTPKSFQMYDQLKEGVAR